MSISIFTITHVPFNPPKDPIYVPLQVGHATHDDYGYLGDDTGDHISEKNQYYSELTGLYWIWKNYTGADYLGLCHYRRFFLNDSAQLMSESDYLDILSRYDVILSESRQGDFDYRTIYGRSHDIRNLDMTGEIIKEKYPDYYPTFLEVIADNHCYVGNLFVAPEKLFHAYCEWLFTIFFALEERIDVENYDDYHKRVFGFLSEQLLIVWVKHNRLSYYEAHFGLSQEKAETIQLKQALRDALHSGDIAGAYSHLCHTLDKRPDLLLEMSDFNQELKTIEHILNVCRVEEEAGLPTLLQFSTDLDVLIKHFRLLVSILEKIQDGTVSEDEITYLVRCKVSYKGIVYAIQNSKSLSAHPLKLLNQLAVIYANAGEPLTALSFLEEAISIHETDQTTIANMIAVLQSMGQDEMAEEYRAFLVCNLRIVVFTGSGIPILDYIAEQYVLALRTLGHTVMPFDKRLFEESMDALFAFQKDGLDLAIVFNNACFQMRLQSGKSLWDIWDTPCINVLVDHPMYYFDTLDNAPSCGIVACADRTHVAYVERFYKSVHKTLFLPTAGECLKDYQDLKPFAERPIDVLFIGSYKYHHDVVYDAFDQKLERELLSHPDETFEEAVERCLQAEHNILTEGELKEFIQSHRFVDVNTNSLFRARILEELVHSGISVTVYGGGWEMLPIFRHPNFLYQGIIPPAEGIALMEDSKIVLNHMAWFKAGASERIFESMLQGAISLTDDSIYLRECFEDFTDIAFYSLDHLDELPQIAQKLLTNSKLSEHIRKKAYQKAKDCHTWEKRIETLLS